MKLSFAFLLTFLLLPLCAEEIPGIVYPKIQMGASAPAFQEVVDAVDVEEGDTVQEGQVLVRLRKAKEELAVREGKLLVKNAEFVAKGATALARDRMGSQENAIKAQTELELAQVRLSLAEEQLGEKTIRAKISGIVVKKYKEAGEAVDRVEKLVDILNIDEVLAQFYVGPKYLSTLQLKQAVSVRFPDLNNFAATGTISFIDQRVDSQSGLLRVKVLISNKDHQIKSGLKAIADFSKKP